MADIYDTLDKNLYLSGPRVTLEGGGGETQTVGNNDPGHEAAHIQVGGKLALDAKDGVLAGPSTGMSSTLSGYAKTPFQADTKGNIESAKSIRFISASLSNTEDEANGTGNPTNTRLDDRGPTFYAANSGTYSMMDDELHLILPGTTAKMVVWHTNNGSKVVSRGYRSALYGALVLGGFTSGAAKEVFSIDLDGDSESGCGGTIRWTITAGEGAPLQVVSGVTVFNSTKTNASLTTIGATTTVDSGTFTATWGVAVAANVATFSITPTTSKGSWAGDALLGYSVESNLGFNEFGGITEL